MPATSPTNIESQRRNEYYPTEEAYLYAIADAMREEYHVSWMQDSCCRSMTPAW